VKAEPFDDTTIDPFRECGMGAIDSVDRMILGANAYVQTNRCWPGADEQGEYGEDDGPPGFKRSGNAHLRRCDASSVRE